ncbi:MAG: DMT family transporter [Alphaproteobacteria bacterium]|jgi:drug/metabolite transporter (DMT)-like permease|nr:DMT family transporter [Alphaproteobacteria bacterium]
MTDQSSGTTARSGWGTSSALPYLLIVLAALIIASNHVLARYLGGVVPPMGMVFWRMVVGALFLLPITAYGLFANRHLILKHWKLFTLMGVLFVPLGNGLIYTAYTYTTAINGGVVSASQPAITVLLTWLMFRDVINWKQGIGIVIAGLGVLVIITQGAPLTILVMDFNKGDLIMLAAIAFAALYNVLIRKVPEQIPVPQLMVIVLVSGAVMTLPLYILETIHIGPVPVNLVTIASILWVGIAVTAIAVGLMSVAIRRIGANKASMSNYMRALFTALLAVVLLGEDFQTFHLVAMVLVIGGVFLMTRGRKSAN